MALVQICLTIEELVSIRYINPDVVQKTSGKSYAMHARGVDNRGNFNHYPEPTSIFSKESLQIHKEICDSQHQVLMASAKEKVLRGQS